MSHIEKRAQFPSSLYLFPSRSMNAPKRPACFLQQQIVVIWCDIWEVFGQVNARHLTREKASWLAAPAFMLIDAFGELGVSDVNWSAVQALSLQNAGDLSGIEPWNEDIADVLQDLLDQLRKPEVQMTLVKLRTIEPWTMCVSKFQVCGVKILMKPCRHASTGFWMKSQSFEGVPGLMQGGQRSGRHSCPVCFVSS